MAEYLNAEVLQTSAGDDVCRALDHVFTGRGIGRGTYRIRAVQTRPGLYGPLVDLISPICELGETTDAGKRRIISITDGNFKEPIVNGEILNKGADWQAVNSDGLAMIDTRYLLKMDGGELVYLQTKGLRYGPADVLADLVKGNRWIRVSITFGFV